QGRLRLVGAPGRLARLVMPRGGAAAALAPSGGLPAGGTTAFRAVDRRRRPGRLTGRGLRRVRDAQRDRLVVHRREVRRLRGGPAGRGTAVVGSGVRGSGVGGSGRGGCGIRGTARGAGVRGPVVGGAALGRCVVGHPGGARARAVVAGSVVARPAGGRDVGRPAVGAVGHTGAVSGTARGLPRVRCAVLGGSVVGGSVLGGRAVGVSAERALAVGGPAVGVLRGVVVPAVPERAGRPVRLLPVRGPLPAAGAVGGAVGERLPVLGTGLALGAQRGHAVHLPTTGASPADLAPASRSPHSVSQLASIRCPCSVRADSGWSCTPSTGSSRWRSPMTMPSDVRAVTSSSAGTVVGSAASEW